MVEALSVAAAARRVNRSTRTIRRWIAAGMPTQLVDGEHRILLPDLQAAFVERLETDVTRVQSPEHLEHGTRHRYENGCRCLPCKAANGAAKNASYAKLSRQTAERRAAAARAAGEPVVLPRWSQEPF